MYIAYIKKIYHNKSIIYVIYKKYAGTQKNK